MTKTAPRRPRILILTGHYFPAYRAGGPIRTLQAIVERLGDEFSLRIITKDRDIGDEHALSGIAGDCWQPVGKAQVRYLAPRNRTPLALCRLLRRTPHDLLYLNSFFDPVSTIQVVALRRFGLLPPWPILLAPRGEFSPGALRLKSRKKRAYITLARHLGLYRDIYWQVSSEQERIDLLNGFFRGRGTAESSRILVAPDLSGPAAVPSPLSALKRTGRLRIVYLSRISPMKNLEFALQSLAGLAGDVSMDIYGPIDDSPFEQAYWARCQERIRQLPSNVVVTYHGPVEPDRVPTALSEHDLFFLPTLGENFGHAILEALAAGLPVLISDRTPWRDLAAHRAGWDLPLEQPGAFAEILQRLVDMDEAEYAPYRVDARARAERYFADTTNVELQRQAFLAALEER